MVRSAYKLPILQHPILIRHLINLRKLQNIEVRRNAVDQNEKKKKKTEKDPHLKPNHQSRSSNPRPKHRCRRASTCQHPMRALVTHGGTDPRRGSGETHGKKKTKKDSHLKPNHRSRSSKRKTQTPASESIHRLASRACLGDPRWGRPTSWVVGEDENAGQQTHVAGERPDPRRFTSSGIANPGAPGTQHR
jgi:hypothetical protein